MLLTKSLLQNAIVDPERTVATIYKSIDGSTITFSYKDCNWTAASVRRPYEPKVFKSLDGAFAYATSLGINTVSVTTLKS